MADTQLEEAKRCPRCKEPGREVGYKPVSAWNTDGSRKFGVTLGAKLHEFMCENTRCKWCKTTFFVQINPDGTIPPPDAPNRARNRLRPLDPALAVTMKDRFQSIQEATTQQGSELHR